MNASARLTWDEYAMGLAIAAARRSEDPHQQVGACALDAEHRVIGVAYNAAIAIARRTRNACNSSANAAASAAFCK